MVSINRTGNFLAAGSKGKASPLDALDDLIRLRSAERAGMRSAAKETPGISDLGGVSPKHPLAKPMFDAEKQVGKVAEEAVEEITRTAEGVYRAGSSIPRAASEAIGKIGEGIDPALLMGGVAAAGLGAAAINKNPKKKESLLESIESGTVAVTDKVMAGVDTGASYVNMAVLPVMLGGVATGLIGTPIAAVSSWLGWGGPSRGLAKVNGVLEKAQGLTVAEAGQKLNQWVGHDVSKGIAKGAQGVANVVAPVSHPLSYIPGMQEMSHSNVKNLPKSLGSHSLVDTAMNAGFIAGSAVSLYGVARDFSKLSEAGRQMIADRTGRKLEDVSTMEFLTSSQLSKSETSARNHLLATSGLHTVVEAATLGMIVKTAAINKLSGMMGMLAWTVPDVVRQAADGFLGASILPLYKGMSDAQKRGEQLPAEAYAEFILSANEQLRNRGMTGKRFAEELGKRYAENNTALHVVLADIDSGKMKSDINDIIERSKAETPAPQAKEMSHVDRIMKAKHGKTADGLAEHGEWSKKIKTEQQLAAMTPASPSIN